MFNEIPTVAPDTPLLKRVPTPEKLRALAPAELPELARQLRHFLLYSVGQTGGHFGGGLGVVELTIALHYLLDTPRDYLVWDVGHQSYPHKILTGRGDKMLSIRLQDGLHPFPDRNESEYDDFGTGHSSTSISAALGMAIASRLKGDKRKSVAVIGDGALTAGLAFEALNHASHVKADMLVILNDNEMSISHSEGGLANYLASKLKSEAGLANTALFEALAFDYTGPIDGHDIPLLLSTLETLLNRAGPQFLHLSTRKGKGFLPAESDPVGYHAIDKIAPIGQAKKPKLPSFANSFGHWACEMAERDTRCVAITPAMKEGSDLVRFAQQYPERFFDVAIAEQHALTFAAGLACAGLKPVVAIYSTFLQRAYDQYIHDIALQKLDVLLAIDRAGLVGQDGSTHAGLYDIAALRCIPDSLIMTPSDRRELKLMLNTGYHYNGPAAVRYPRGGDTLHTQFSSDDSLEIGRANLLRTGASKIVILNFGPLLESARTCAEQWDLSLVDMRFVKPLDETLLDALCENHSHFITLEDHAVTGGAGSAVMEYLAPKNVRITALGVPDRWIGHATKEQQLAQCGLDSTGISALVSTLLS
ncbi:MAG: 1-deoxy-D-xylulose-5-phosphate synthase [Pseudomonadales bacterium]